jgi:hypothetical protein
MKNNKRKRRANQPNQLPWFENFRTQLLNRAFANHFAGRGRYHAKMNPYWVAGTTAGLALCVFDQQREDYSAKPPSAEDLRASNEEQWSLLYEIGSVAWMRKADAVQFLSGVLSELNRRVALRGHDADVILRVLKSEEVLECPTMRHVADLVKRQLPPEKVGRWTDDQHKAFYNRVRMFCQRMGFTPSKPGRPNK